ncbi:unnamed protein product [Lathyrus oleraceus]|uniref:Uncharacterized protein n=1 Tax=Pisum sativum TaxID=3888 RepID=A0A9D5B1P9_PEA|nr:uncharacterized protein LOC127126205 [Pisum sativum]KAI5426830.1 hypothetical protein KIW84_032310 [Pisum sativum]
MNSSSLGSFILTPSPPCKLHNPRFQTKPHVNFHHPLKPKFNFSTSLKATESSSNTNTPVSIPEEDASYVAVEEFIDKDWSVLDYTGPNTDRIISSGKIDENSRVLVSTGSEEFVDCLVDSSKFKSLLVLHDSLLILALLIEKYDNVMCWQGEVTIVPEKWAPFDAVFLYFLPALPFKLEDILGSLALKCSPGGRVIISHPQGREILKQQRQQYPEVVVSDLPDKAHLQSVAAAYSFDVAEFVDEPGFYLAVLICSRT